MRITWLILVALAHTAFADEKAKPNTLTPDEAAGGLILLFDGSSTFGWEKDGDVEVRDGMLVVGGEKATTLVPTTPFRFFYAEFEVSRDGKEWTTGKLDRFPTGVGGYGVTMTTRGLPPGFEVRLKNNIQLEFAVTAKTQVYLRSARLLPNKMDSLFNGKDLTGWRQFQPTKDKKVSSKFSVTKEGWLNVKDGPGDLQTEGQWADFVAQFECISNGKHLNSGLFFRCIPDQYQQGYEAQIRNEWEGDDRTKPVDFGTGAIYRRQKARKVVSTDGEWFTMTVAAHGRHIATWVNGYQVTDWTDDRKENDNARNGFKKGKGALSIQGHDPTTDLSFRNIRIQSLDPK
jgi:Domain of Unknown Function (DUF1080)